MNEIFYNSYHQKLNINIDNNKNIYKTNSNSNAVESEISLAESSTNDSIEINEQNENIINTKKASDAFKDACSNFGYVETSNGGGADMSLYYNTAIILMKDQGISTPSFIPDSQNDTSYLSFIDKVKDFATGLNSTNPGILPNSFLDFCDSYKEKLIQYGCK